MASPPRQLDQHDVGVLLHLLQHDFTPVGRDVEVAHVEVRSEISQRMLSAGLQIDQPEVLVTDLSFFAASKGKEVVVQVAGTGPTVFTYVNPAEDPRKRK